MREISVTHHFIFISQNGFDDIVNVLLDQGADANLAMTNGTTALIAACTRGYPSVVRLLLKAGANIEAACDQTNALMYACINGYADVAFMLLDAGIKVDAVNAQGWSPLLLSAERGCYQILHRLIEMGADVNIQSRDAQWTPLMSASANGFHDIAEELIINGASVNAQQGGGWNALMIAVQAGETDIVRLLLQHKAEIFDTKQSIRPTFNTSQLNDVPDGAVPLIGAALGGHTEILSLLLSHGADPNTKTTKGQTALMIAAARGTQCLQFYFPPRYHNCR